MGKLKIFACGRHQMKSWAKLTQHLYHEERKRKYRSELLELIVLTTKPLSHASHMAKNFAMNCIIQR